MTVNQLILGYLRFADGYYRKNGEPTGEYDSIRHSLKPLRRLYREAAVADFGPLALKTVRDEMIKADLCRNEINKRVGRIVRTFKWGVENEFVDAMTHHGLSQVRGLSRGRTAARESKPVKPVPDAHIDPLRPHVAGQVWAMIELQRTTGMRPGEACIIRSGDIDRNGAVWVYRPETHKSPVDPQSRSQFILPWPRGRDDNRLPQDCHKPQTKTPVALLPEHGVCTKNVRPRLTIHGCPLSDNRTISRSIRSRVAPELPG